MTTEKIITLVTIPAPVVITYVCATEDNKAVRKLAEERATQEVRRAVNAWIYSQEG